MRPLLAVTVAVLSLGTGFVTGCDDGPSDPSGLDDGPGDHSGTDDPSVTFRGTAVAGSMAPTLQVGDRIVATEVDASGLRVGDVVVYRNPGFWLAGQNEGEGQLVHRVIGTPGDTVACCDAAGRVSVNGAPLDEPYLAPSTARCDAAILGYSTRAGSTLRGPCDWSVGPVPDDAVFVLGDNREASSDSRFHICPMGDGCGQSPWVPIELVRGVVELP